MGHTCDLASSQTEARKLFTDNHYDYVLLDQNIPVKSGRPSHATNGENLLWTIRRTKGYDNIPVIVMVPDGPDSSEFAFKIMRNAGTNNFVLKPFSSRALGKAIRDALKEAHSPKPHNKPTSKPEPPRQFERGELTFY